MSSCGFEIDVRGVFAPGQVHVVWRDEPRPSTPALDRLISDTWAEQEQRARDNGTMLFNGRLARYLRHRVEGGTLTVEAGPTDFAAFLATNYLNFQRVGEFGAEKFSNPLGTSTVLATGDGWLAFGRRNHRVACHPGCVQNFGGSVEADALTDDGRLDVFADVARELEEELGIGSGDVLEHVCLGILRDGATGQPEFIFDSRVPFSRRQIDDLLEIDHPEQEHQEIVYCPAEPDAILAFIRATERMTPVAAGSLCLHGGRRYGDEWFARAAGLVKWSPPPRS